MVKWQNNMANPVNIRYKDHGSYILSTPNEVKSRMIPDLSQWPQQNILY